MERRGYARNMSSRGRQAAEEEMDRQVVRDRRFGLLAILTWGGISCKLAPALSRFENVNSLLRVVAIFGVSVAWPTWNRDSYCRNRLAALSFLRVFLFALPFNYSSRVFNAMAPQAQAGWLAPLCNVFQALIATHILLLVFIALGWQLPFRLHCTLQAINIGLLTRFGLHPYCRSKLLTSPQADSVVAAANGAMSLVAAASLPAVAAVVPKSIEHQRAAVLLLCWVLLGLLLPTLLLLPETNTRPHTRPQLQPQQPAIVRLTAKAFDAFEAGLRMLRPSVWREPRQRVRGGRHRALLPAVAAPLTLCWSAMLLVLWTLCCLSAPQLTALSSRGPIF